MEFLIIGATTLNVFALYALAKVFPSGLKGLGVHPYNVLGFLIAIIIIDFIVLSIDVRGSYVQSVFGYRVTSAREVQDGALFFLMCASSLTIGIGLAGYVRAKRRSRIRPQAIRDDRWKVSMIMFAFTIIFSVVVLYLASAALAAGSLLHVAGTRTTYFRDNTTLYVAIAAMVPAFFMYGSRFGLNRKTGFYAFLLLLGLPLVGSRSLMLYVLAGLVFWSAFRFPLKLSYIYISAPIIGILSVTYRYYSRDIYYFSSLGAFLDRNGGFFGSLFRTDDIAIAEIITIGVNNRIVEREWFESLLGMLLVPVPRAILPWKPLGASADFTSYTDESYFDLTGSSKTVSGFVDIYLSSNFFVAPILMGVIGALWGMFWVSTDRSQRTAAFVGPVLVVCAYLFIRSDLYNLALFMWPLFVVIGLKKVLSSFISSRKPRASAILNGAAFENRRYIVKE